MKHHESQDWIPTSAGDSKIEAISLSVNPYLRISNLANPILRTANSQIVQRVTGDGKGSGMYDLRFSIYDLSGGPR
jgi:hypothetical protein